MTDGKRHTIRPTYAPVVNNSDVLLIAAMEGAGITLTVGWLAEPALRARRRIEDLCSMLEI